MTVVESPSKREDTAESFALPAPTPGLIGLHRVREPGKSQEALVRLNRNERLQPLPEWFIRTLRESLQSALLTTYPSTDGLYRRLSAQLGVAEEQLLLTAGSDAAVKALYHAYVRPGETVLVLDPSYAMYQVYAKIFQAEAVRISFDHDLTLDIRRLVDSIVPDVRLVMLANPNQPTATLLNEDALLQVIKRASEVGALVAIDEAYYPFSQTTALPWIKEYSHLVVIRTFSKAAGLAGLRIGFVAGHENVIVNLHKVRSIYDVNSMAICCASQILDHPQIIDDYVAKVEAGKQLLIDRARSLGLIPLPTHTNFLLIRVAHRSDPSLIVERLHHRGYLVKGLFDALCLRGCIRVTLGPPALMTQFANALEAVLTFD